MKSKSELDKAFEDSGEPGDRGVVFSKPGDLQRRLLAALDHANPEQRVLLQGALLKDNLGKLSWPERHALDDVEEGQGNG